MAETYYFLRDGLLRKWGQQWFWHHHHYRQIFLEFQSVSDPFRCTNWTYFDRILANLLLHCFPKAFLPQFRRLDHGLLHVGHRRGLFFSTLFPLRFGVIPFLAGCDCDSFRFFRLGFFASFNLAVRIGVDFHWNGDGYWNRVRGAGCRRHDEAGFWRSVTSPLRFRLPYIPPTAFFSLYFRLRLTHLCCRIYLRHSPFAMATRPTYPRTSGPRDEVLEGGILLRPVTPM